MKSIEHDIGAVADLLPKELGRCDYETGDDGRMLTTVRF